MIDRVSKLVLLPREIILYLYLELVFSYFNNPLHEVRFEAIFKKKKNNQNKYNIIFRILFMFSVMTFIPKGNKF